MCARTKFRADSHLCQSCAGVSCHRLISQGSAKTAFNILAPETRNADEARNAVLVLVREMEGERRAYKTRRRGSHAPLLTSPHALQASRSLGRAKTSSWPIVVNSIGMSTRKNFATSWRSIILRALVLVKAFSLSLILHPRRMGRNEELSAGPLVGVPLQEGQII